MSTQLTGETTPAGSGIQSHVQYAQEMDALFQIGVAITAGLTVEQVLQSILDECRRVLPVDTLYVALYDAPSDSYEIPLFFDVGEYHSIERIGCSAARSLTCDVIAQRSALYIPDVHDPAAMRDHVAVKVAQGQTRAYLGVPMIFRERIIGVLSIQSLQVNAYNPSVIQLLQTIAMQAAVAVENARLYEAAQREIAERREIEEELRVMATKYAALFDAAPVGISITDNDGRIVESNREAEHMLGISREEHLERTYDGPEWQIVRPDGTPMPPGEYASVRAFQEQRRIDNIEMGIVHSDGSICWISVNAVPIPLEGYGVAIAYTDITERRRAEDALRQSNELFRMLADNVHDAVWVGDLQGNLTYASPSIAQQWGYWWEELTGRSPEGRAVSPEAVKAARQRAYRMLRAARENRPVPDERFDLTVRRNDGGEIRMDVLQSPLMDSAGRITGFLYVGRDVTVARTLAAEIRSLNATLEQRVAERTAELSGALDQLRQVDRMKDEFLASLSHELRTPLSVILGATEVLGMEDRGPLNETQQHMVKTINTGGERLLTMVNNLLRYASLTVGRTTLWYDRCALIEVANATIIKANRIAAAKQIRMTWQVTPPTLTIVSDAEAIMTMLDALLDNAIKFTPAGGNIELTMAGDGDERVHMVVADDGIGMTIEKQRQVFNPFVQGDGALSRQHEGMGLGLAYVARMAEALGGTVSVESEAGYGSRFTVALPIHHART